MAKIMAVNAGSSSLKIPLLDMPSELVICSGIVERIGLDEGIFTIKHNGQKKTEKLPIPDHKVAVSLVLDALVKENIVEKLEEIEGVGHRIVHGGEYTPVVAVIGYFVCVWLSSTFGIAWFGWFGLHIGLTILLIILFEMK